MHRTLLLILIMMSSTFFISCHRNGSLSEILREMESNPVKLDFGDFPCCINGVDTVGYALERSKYRLVVFIDSTECNSCRLSHLEEWNDWIELADRNNGKFSLVFLLQPRVEETSSIIIKMRWASKVYKGIPLFVDKEGDFLKRNFRREIPTLMHTMLLDSNNMVVYVGDPTRNEQVCEDMKKIINIK